MSTPAASESSPRRPDLVIALDADDRTADAARFCVGTIARPAPAARERAELLTGALLARAGSVPPLPAGCPIQLRVWTRAEPARVELEGPPELVTAAGGDRDAARLLDEHADRWGVENEGLRARVWFEIALPDDAPAGADRELAA